MRLFLYFQRRRQGYLGSSNLHRKRYYLINTFLPYQDFSKSAAALDDKRLNNQINEALIILRTLTGWYAKNEGKGWPNHPCTKQWAGYEAALSDYALACLGEYHTRHENYQGIDARLKNIRELDTGEKVVLPQWLTEEFCRGHRQLLLEKDFAFYSTKFDVDREEMV